MGDYDHLEYADETEIDDQGYCELFYDEPEQPI